MKWHKGWIKQTNVNYDLMAERLKIYQTDFLSFKQKALRIQACYQRREPIILEMEVSFFRKQRQVFYAIERADDQIIECDT